MAFGAFLEKKQPYVWKTFLREKEEGRLGHAFLLSGEAGTPLKETAFFLTKSLICDHPNPLACETCRTCERVEHGNYSDLLFLNGEEGSIKKGEVETLVGNFAKTAIESKGIMIYIIHLVENMTVEAVNALLKFLEEPATKTYAFLTTENEARILPTIVSRCETMRLLLRPRKEVISEAIKEGTPQKDAEIISYFMNSPASVKIESQSEDYIGARTAFEIALDALSGPRSAIIYGFEKNIVPMVRGKEMGRYFLDMLSLAYKDLVSIADGGEIVLTSYATLLKSLSKKSPHPQTSLYAILEARGQIDLNISLAALIEHVAALLSKED
ncbi:MAG: hypothetical protein LKG11_05600 [Bacilli bacterium]|jgi:DNA polymerase-3 subunit delta'|nr:hypothetical protein [Bacilli bacterium]